MVITSEQEKLLLNATRIRILRALAHAALTAKQVADKLGGSKGNVHYHVQRLLDGGLLDLVETREVSGILEKYYRAKAAIYTRAQTAAGATLDAAKWDQINSSDSGTRVVTRLMLTPQQRTQFHADVVSLLERWEDATIRVDLDEAVEYAIDVSITSESTLLPLSAADSPTRPGSTNVPTTDEGK